MYLDRWLRSFTSVTPENALKWEVVEPRRGQLDFTEADAIVTAAQRTGKRVRGHPLLWDQQLPAWVTDRSWGAKALEDVIRAHVRALVSRYRGRVAEWDVVNEPLDNDGSFTKSVFFTTLGERFIDIAFDEAHRADPDAKLFLNELAAEGAGPKQDALVALVRRLRERDVPIDGVGLQNHTTVGGAPSKAALEAAFARFARLGVAVEITEMDVAVPPGGSLAAQGSAYAAAAGACAQTAACTGLTVWGVTDRWSWLGAAERPLLFTGGGASKPAAAAVAGALSPPG